MSKNESVIKKKSRGTEKRSRTERLIARTAADCERRARQLRGLQQHEAERLKTELALVFKILFFTIT